nr:hypothetical protein [Candidatus Omnitrophota bacterium]
MQYTRFKDNVISAANKTCEYFRKILNIDNEISGFTVTKEMNRNTIPLLSDAKTANRDTVFVNVKDLIYRSKVWEAISISNDPQIYLYHNLA